ncbi:hypothetical protein [Tenggerimyces flavus]|uniref:Uncharacterized protein n=1 Tax=Tenggerimyces flavus TaxID=1708749 RepID=A0ABV7YD05_9ACTN|nr:hypothetical protein [Tenggerimyces flavus]MBM7788030.1 hypothetical protein [Tenggerimyces flavus]
MRGTWKRIAAVVGLAVAVLVPTSGSGAQAVVPPDRDRALSPIAVFQECATALRIEGHWIASCGQARAGEGRVGTYDSVPDRITWGPWRTRFTQAIPNSVTATDGTSGRFIGFPVVSNAFGWAVVHGTQYQRTTDAQGRVSYVGRRGVYTYLTNRFVPDGSGWYPTVACPPAAPCPGWWYEPIPERSKIPSSATPTGR